MASRLSRLPVRVGNSGASGAPARSASHALSTVRMVGVSGVRLVLSSLADGVDVGAGRRA